nr:DUF47 family protein [Candidatus Sigynarchaeota archaeon]
MKHVKRKKNLFATKEMHEILHEILDLLKEQASKMEALVQQSCEGSAQGKIAANSLVGEIIDYEKKIDRVKEVFTVNLYKQKGFLPSIQKNDYLFIVETIDEIADEMEIVARQFQIYEFNFPEALKTDFVGLAEAVTSTVETLVDEISFLFKDFKMTENAWIKVQDERRAAREQQWTLHAKILDMESDFKALLMHRALVKVLISVADKAEDFSDSINALAIKYLMLD